MQRIVNSRSRRWVRRHPNEPFDIAAKLPPLPDFVSRYSKLRPAWIKEATHLLGSEVVEAYVASQPAPRDLDEVERQWRLAHPPPKREELSDTIYNIAPGITFIVRVRKPPA